MADHSTSKQKQGFWASLFHSILRDIAFMVMAFIIGTLGFGAVCLYYGAPLFLSVIGGIAVLGFALMLKTETLFGP